EARLTGAALSPSGALLALSQIDGELLQFEVEVTSAAGTLGLAPQEEFGRALAARDAGKTAEARQALLRVLEADPAHLPACDALVALDEAARVLALDEADRLAAESRFAEAVAALEAVRALLPGDLDLPRRWTEIMEA